MGLLEPPVLLHLRHRFQSSRPALLGTVPSALQNGIKLTSVALKGATTAF